jgi:hypothetical protein
VPVPACMRFPRSHCVLGVRLITTLGGLTQGRPPSPAIMVCNAVTICVPSLCGPLPVRCLTTDTRILLVIVLYYAGAYLWFSSTLVK